MAFRIYTKTGDKGETSLFGGKRLPKFHIRIEAYGTVDELNSFLGLLRDEYANQTTSDLLIKIQNDLFDIGSVLARDPEKEMNVEGVNLEDITMLENAIDRMEETLEPLKNFILPGGHRAVSTCHIARCVCRRAERLIVALDHEEGVDELIIQYLNRLSDLLFVLARKIGKDVGASEQIWKSRK